MSGWTVVPEPQQQTQGWTPVPEAAPAPPNHMGGPDLGSMWNVVKEAGKDLLDSAGGMAEMFSGSPVTAPLKLGAEMAQGHIQAYQDAKDAAQHGNVAKAMFKSVAAGVPIVGPMASDIYDDAEAGNNDRAIGKGVSRILQLTAPEVAPKAVSALADSIPKSVPRSALSKVIKPDAPIEFHAAEQSAIPKINAAAQDLGQPIKTADDAIAAIRQAKQNALLDAHEAAGPGKTIADLPPEQVKALQDDMSALDTLQKHITDAKAKAATPAPTAKSPNVVGKIATDAVGTVIPQAAHAINLGKTALSLVDLLKRKNALTAESLDSAIRGTFKSANDVRSAPSPATVGQIGPDPFLQAPGQVATGDLSVQHEGNIAPPETPHGDAAVYPDRPNPAIVSSGSTAQPLASKPVSIGPNVRPAASTTQLDSTLRVQPPEQIAPPVKQPLKATTPAAQTAEVLKKAGVQQALKDAGVAAPSATVRQIRPGIEVAPTFTPRMDLTFYGDKTGEGASLMQLTRYNINELRAMAVQRGLDVSPTETHVQLIEKIHDDLSPQEIKEFSDAAAERGRFSPPAKAKRGSRPQATVQPHAGTEEPPVSAPAAPPERRTNLDYRQAIDAMSPEEQVKALYQSDKTELPNKRAFDWAEKTRGPAKAIGMSDADGLKAMNDKHGYAAGDALLKAKADALREAGLEAFHDKGDEFMFRGDSPEDMTAKLDKAKDILQNKVIEFKDSQGNVRHFSGAQFSYGTGSDLSTAEAALKANKSGRKASGAAAGRGEMGSIKEVKP